MTIEPRSYFSIKEQNAPSLDTWVPSTNFLQLGFRPGYSLQARELIEMQSIIQNQISVFAQELGYAHGSIIKICETDPRLNSLNEDGTGLYTASFSMNPGYMFVKGTDRLGYFVRYNASFSDGSPLQHTLIWSSNDDPSDNLTKFAFIGVEYTEETISPEEDIDLYDNAAGFPNFNAPGAVRYHINIESDMKVKELNLPISWNPANEVDTGEFDKAVNNAVVNDHNGEFASSNFIPLCYWNTHEPNILRILHSNRQEYEIALDENGVPIDDPYLQHSLYRKVTPTNLQVLSSDSGPYEGCRT
jgi:hypothetical protein